MAVRAAAGTGYLSKASAVTGAPYTIIAWYKTNDVTAAYTNLASINNNAATQYDYNAISSAVDTAVLSGSQSAGVDSASGAVALDTWAPVSMTRTSNTRVVWSVQTRIAATNSTAETGGYDLFTLLGFNGMPSEPNRDVAGYKAWNALLTNDEIALEVQQFAPVRQTNLAHYSPLHDHTDLADDVAGGSWTNNSATLSTVTGPDIPEEWTGPTIASSNTTAATSSSGGLSINMPSGIAAGDLLLAFASNDTAVGWTSGWTTIDDGANSTVVQGAVFAKIAAGGDTLTITGEANDIAVVTVRVVNHGVTNVSTDITLGSAATGTDSAPNAPNCNPGSSASRLWLSYFAADDDDNTTYWWPVEAAPVSQTKSTTGTSSCMVGVAQRWLTASSYNPSTFLMAASEEWRAQTLGIPPAATTAALTGSAATSGAGTLGVSSTTTVTGSAATASAGTLTPTTAAALTGSGVTASAGTLTPDASYSAALTGEAVTASAGTLVPVIAQALAGSEVAASAGTLTPVAEYSASLTGESITVSAGTPSPEATAVLAGEAATVSAGTLAPVVTAAASGAEVAASAGTVGVVVEVAASGAEVTTAAGTLTPETEADITVALTGSAVTVSAGTLSAAAILGLTGSEVSADAGSLGFIVAVTGGDPAHKHGFAGRRYAVKLGRDLVYVDSPQALQAAIREYESYLEQQAKEKAQRLARERPRASARVITRRLPKVEPVDVEDAEVAVQAQESNERIREMYKMQMRAALIAVNLELLADEEAALAVLM